MQGITKRILPRKMLGQRLRVNVGPVIGGLDVGVL